MLSYYTALIALCWMALGVLCILVYENSWIPREDKRLFYLTYGIIAFSALAEWTGIQLSGNASVPGWVLTAVKCADYVLTPMAGGAIVAQMKLRDRWNRALNIVLIVNAVFQIAAAFFGWMVVVDAQNHYTHGPLYPIYVAVYMVVIALTGVEFLAYGRSYRRQNKASLYTVLLLVLVGIAFQEVLGGEYRTAYLALTMGAVLMFIHYAEFYQLTAEAAEQAEVPADFAAFTIDINGLKLTNDTIGHDAGDELIVGAARCIERVMGETNRCYRTGGDEFVVLANMDKGQADVALIRLEQETGSWTGDEVKALSLAAGYALAGDHPGLTVEELVKKADQAMYAAKAEYYRNSGNDRRGRR